MMYFLCVFLEVLVLCKTPLYKTAYLSKLNACCEKKIVEEISGCGKGDLKIGLA